MKIAVFLYDYPSKNRTYVSSLYDMLISSGHEVNVYSFFIRDPADSFEESNVPHLSSFTKIKKGLFRHFPYFADIVLKYYHKYISDINVKKKLEKELRIINKKIKSLNTYDCSIGIEKGGIICAYKLYEIFETPFFYFSLELYDENHPFILQSIKHKLMRSKEVLAHKEAVGTIIADEDRKKHLYKTGNIDADKPAFYLPISFNEKFYKKGTPAQSYNNNHKKVILNFGYNRMPDDFFISFVKKLPNEYVFLMHHFDTKHHEELSQKYSLNNTQFSNMFIDENSIMKIIDDSFIGVCWYCNESANDRLIAFSSEKTARYLAAGKPIIANGETNFSRLFSSIKCGIAVKSPEEFIDALHKITENYQEFSLNATKAYNKIYKLSNYQLSLSNFIQSNVITHTPICL